MRFVLPAIYYLGRSLYSNVEGAFATILFALLITPLYFSQEARVYSPLILFTILSSISLLLLLENKFSSRLALFGLGITYVLITSITCYLHCFGFVFFAVQVFVLTLLGFFSKKVRRVWWWLVAVGLCYAPGLKFCLKVSGGHRYLNNTYRLKFDFFDAFSFFIGRVDFIGLAPETTLLAYPSALLCVVAVAVGVKHLMSSKLADPCSRRDAAVLFALVSWAIVPLILADIHVRLSPQIYRFRYLLICLPAWYLLIARGIACIPLNRSLRVVFAVTLIAGLTFYLLDTQEYYSRYRKEGYRDLVAHVVRRHQELIEQEGTSYDPAKTAVFIKRWYWHISLLRYYFGRYGLRLPVYHYRANRSEFLSKHPEKYRLFAKKGSLRHEYASVCKDNDCLVPLRSLQGPLEYIWLVVLDRKGFKRKNQNRGPLSEKKRKGKKKKRVWLAPHEILESKKFYWLRVYLIKLKHDSESKNSSIDKPKKKPKKKKAKRSKQKLVKGKGMFLSGAQKRP